MNSKITLLIFLTFSIVNSIAQSWFPKGSKAYYTNSYYESLENPNYISIESIRDSLINDTSVKVLDIWMNNAKKISSEYIYQDSNKIFYYNYFNKKFHLLYNFSAKIGDTISVHNSPFKPTIGFNTDSNISFPRFKYIITNIDSIYIFNKWLQRQKINKIFNDEWSFGNSDSYIIYGIGNTGYFFGEGYYTAPELVPTFLRCYNEQGFEYKNPIWNLPCDFYLNNKELEKSNLLFYPNPFNDYIEFNTENNIEQIILYDLEGSIKSIFNNVDNNTKINTSDLPKGIYFLETVHNDLITTYKIIKY